MKENELTINGAKCVYIKQEESIEFICARCKRRKISKKYIQIMGGSKNQYICNACYGNLLSKK